MHANHKLQCVICKMDTETRKDIEYLYVHYVDPRVIAREHKIKESIIRRHALQAGWYEAKAKNVKYRFVDVSSEQPEIGWKGGDILRAAENVAKIEGQIDDAANISIHLQGLSLADLMAEEKLIDDKLKNIKNPEDGDENEDGDA